MNLRDINLLAPRTLRPLATSAVIAALTIACAPPQPLADAGPEPEPCVYPRADFDPMTGTGDIIPALKWRGFDRGEEVEIDLEKVYCGEQYAEYDSLFFVLHAEWCPECPAYMGFIAEDDARLEFAGAKLIYVDMETRNFELPTSESAEGHTTGIVGANIGARVGELDGDPAGYIRDLKDDGFWLATPNAFFVRKTDMKVITRQQDGRFLLPWVKVAQDLDKDWSDPDNATFVNNCEEGDEDGEPNNVISAATLLEVGEHRGGVCNESEDYYRIEVAGDWTVELEFAHLEADLDVYQVNTAGEIIRIGGIAVGSETEGDIELFGGTGPASIMVRAKDDYSTQYTIRLNAL